ncbi:MAG: hypothetical protein QOE14_1205 [Humisphaera sp.]|nr:hypothetical protein [Humisphaera sp.]
MPTGPCHACPERPHPYDELIPSTYSGQALREIKTAAAATTWSGDRLKKHETAEGKRASKLIDGRIEELGAAGDWRGKVLAQVRAIIRKADARIVEEWKWRGTPVWSHDGIVCTGETYKQVVKLTFARGARLKDPVGLFNSSLDGNTRRAIDIREGEKINQAALRALVREAVALNSSTTNRR